jgi:ABC-2 type transport system ATP-binding protein
MLIIIHDGRILFEQEKDYLLDNYRLIKGDVKALTAENKKLFLNIQITDFGFSDITDQINEVQKSISGVLVEKPSILFCANIVVFSVSMALSTKIFSKKDL